jgi:hypothetical protein
MSKQKFPRKFVKLCQSVTAKRPKIVIDHAPLRLGKSSKILVLRPLCQLARTEEPRNLPLVLLGIPRRLHSHRHAPDSPCGPVVDRAGSPTKNSSTELPIFRRMFLVT